MGAQAELISYTQQFIQSSLCASGGCGSCIVCTQVKKHQHYLMRWIIPENNYTVNTVEPIFETIKFQLNPDEHFFFVLERSELLTLAVANSLLKSLEEPPPGYHFILLSSHKDALLPTIVSRCLVQQIDSKTTSTNYNLTRFFTETETNLLDFLKELDRAKLAERDIINFLDQIQATLVTYITQAYISENGQLAQRIMHKLTILDKAREKLPMPGSSKLFLRNLFLQFKYNN